MLLVLLLVVLSMSLAERAQAQPKPKPRLSAKAAAFDPATGKYTGQRQANDPWLTAIMDSGRAFWASRGVTLPEQIRLEVADDLRGSDEEDFKPMGRGWQDGSGVIALDSEMVGQTLAAARSRRRPTQQRRVALKELAATLLHEMGHTGGLPHADNEGFMSARGGVAVVPQETARVIRRLVPRRRGEKSRGIYGIG